MRSLAAPLYYRVSEGIESWSDGGEMRRERGLILENSSSSFDHHFFNKQEGGGDGVKLGSDPFDAAAWYNGVFLAHPFLLYLSSNPGKTGPS
eukprot:c14053_g1_i1 orf=909-1184(-)